MFNPLLQWMARAYKNLQAVVCSVHNPTKYDDWKYWRNTTLTYLQVVNGVEYHLLHSYFWGQVTPYLRVIHKCCCFHRFLKPILTKSISIYLNLMNYFRLGRSERGKSGFFHAHNRINQFYWERSFKWWSLHFLCSLFVPKII